MLQLCEYKLRNKRRLATMMPERWERASWVGGIGTRGTRISAAASITKHSASPLTRSCKQWALNAEQFAKRVPCVDFEEN